MHRAKRFLPVSFTYSPPCPTGDPFLPGIFIITVKSAPLKAFHSLSHNWWNLFLNLLPYRSSLAYAIYPRVGKHYFRNSLSKIPTRWREITTKITTISFDRIIDARFFFLCKILSLWMSVSFLQLAFEESFPFQTQRVHPLRNPFTITIKIATSCLKFRLICSPG